MQFSTFSFAQQHNVRAFEQNGMAWFVAADICAALEIQNVTQALEKLDDDERSMLNIGRSETHGGGGEVNIINESGLYILILRSRKAMEKGTVAWKFRKWVTNEVLPSIRKTGHYELHLDRWLEEWEREQIRAAVKERCARTGETSQAVYAKLHRFIGVPSYEQIGASQFQTALNFLASMPDELFRQGIVMTEKQVYQLSTLTRYAQQMSRLYRYIHPALRVLGSDYSGEAGSWAEVPHYWIREMQAFLTDALPQITNPEHIKGIRDNFARMN